MSEEHNLEATILECFLDSMMAKASSYNILGAGGGTHTTTHEEDIGLLSGNTSDDEDIVVHAGNAAETIADEPLKTPRTPNRVRFDLPPLTASSTTSGAPPSYDDSIDHYANGTALSSHHEPLLTSNGAPPTSPSSRELNYEGPLEHLNRPKSSLRSAMSNMANSIIGAGIIGQPYALRQAGLLTGVTLLILLTITVDWTIRLIVINSKLSGRDSFQGTVEHCFGKVGLVAISVAQWAFAFGGMVAFGVIVGDSIPHVLEAVWPGLGDIPVLGLLINRRVVIFVFIMGISWPLSLYRDIAKLAKASTLALISMVIILITVVTQGFTVPEDSRGTFDVRLLTINNGVFQAIGVISFAFVCHHNSLLIYGSLKRPTLDRFSLVTHISTFVSLIACLTMALSGFLTFASKTQGNVLNNFPKSNTMVNIARFCFGLNMLTTLPLEAFVCREVMFNYWPGEGKRVSTGLHIGVSTSLVASSMLISLIVCDLGAVFELIGATSACALAYILPPLCYIKLSTRSYKWVPAVGCVLFGCAVMAISVVQAVTKIVRNNGEPAQCH